MNRLLLSVLVLMSLVGQAIAADVKGQLSLKCGRQIGPEELKNGDTIVFRNGMTNNYDRECDQQDLTRVFLCGTRLYDSRGWGGTVVSTLGVLKGLSTDNFFVAESADDIKDPDGKTTYPAFIFKHVDTGKYISMSDNNDHGGSCLSTKNKATAFALGYAVGYTTNTTYTENQNEKTAYLFRFINGVKYHYGPAWNYGFTEQTKNRDNICWNIFQPVYGEATALDFVESMYQEFKGLTGYEFGKDPGFYSDVDAVFAFEDLIWEVGDGLSYNLINEDNAEEWKTKMINAQKKLEDSRVPMREGYYYIVNGGNMFSSAIIDKRGMTANGVHELNWCLLDKDNPFHFFKVQALTDTTWSIQNICTNEYIGGLDSEGAVKTSSTPIVGIKLQNLSYYPEWTITDTETSTPYFAYGYSSGKGVIGSVKTQTGGHNTPSAWIFEQENDEARINKLIDDGKAMYASSAIKAVIAEAKVLYLLVKEYQEMLKISTQIKSNAVESTKGSYTALIDGSNYTFFHSEYTTNKAGGPHNIQVDLGSDVAVTKFNFTFTGLTPECGLSAHDTPNDIEIYATNDATLGRSARSDLSSWTRITRIQDTSLPDAQNATYTSEDIDLGDAYRYLRFVVRGTTSGNKNQLSGEYYFNLTNFQIYSAESQETQYNSVPGMKEACDKMEKLIVESEEKMMQSKVKQADIDALYASVKAVRELFVNRQELDDELAELIEEADEVYAGRTIPLRQLLNDPEQLLVNSQNDESFPVEQLIDGKTEGYYGMESVWTDQMLSSSNTVDSWLTWLELNRTGQGQVGIGYGYHNFQVSFKSRVQKFYMVIHGRDNTDYTDTPCYFEILATNEDALGVVPNNNNADKWVKIMDLDATKDVPYAKKVVYTSPLIDMGAAYKYVRFVIKNTALFANTTMRKIQKPEITGITWNAVEWQIYEKRDSTEMLYYTNDEMKTLVDDLKTLTDADREIPKLSMLTRDKIQELRDQIDAVYAYEVYITDVKAVKDTHKGNGTIVTLDGMPVNEQDLRSNQLYVIDGKVVKISK